MICSGRAPCPVCGDGGGLLPASMDSDKTDTDMLMVMEVIMMMTSTKQKQLIFVKWGPASSHLGKFRTSGD